MFFRFEHLVASEQESLGDAVGYPGRSEKSKIRREEEEAKKKG